VVRSALRTLDDRGVTGRIWMGAAYDSLTPAPAHRFTAHRFTAHRFTPADVQDAHRYTLAMSILKKK
jgi:hypothetical protein